MKHWASWLLLSMVALATLPVAAAFPAPKFRMCGAHLSTFLSLVCGNRGYFAPISTHTRDKRSPGIVEECCRSSCSLATWQQYCAEPASTSQSSASAAGSTEEPSNHLVAGGEEEVKTLPGRKGGRVRKTKGGGHRLLPNGCSCRRRRKNLLRKRLREALRLHPDRVFQIGTITPYYESNQVISPIDESHNLHMQHH